MLRISTTTLEAFRRLIETPWSNDAELAASIRGEQLNPSWQMLVGSAWDSLLSNPWDEAKVTPMMASGAYRFNVDHVREALKHVGPGLCQVKAMRVWETVRERVTVVAQVDHVRGMMLTENKAKLSPSDAKDYEPSLQWRYYLAVHGAACVRYNLFAFADPDKDNYCALKDITSFRFWPYTDLESDCVKWLDLFLDWADERGLLFFLDREGSTVGIEGAA